jgi:hypothetical protein
MDLQMICTGDTIGWWAIDEGHGHFHARGRCQSLEESSLEVEFSLKGWGLKGWGLKHDY